MTLITSPYSTNLTSAYAYEIFDFDFDVDLEMTSLLMSTTIMASKPPIINRANITGTNGADNLVGTSGIDQIFGLEGSDTIEGLGGADTLDGGTDQNFNQDVLSYENSTAAVTVNLQNNTASGGHAQGDTISNFENIIGSAFDDVLTGVTGSTRTAPGTAWIIGGLGADTLDGDNKALASFATAASGVIASLETGMGTGGEAAGDSYSNIVGFRGSDFDDIFEGKNGHISDRIYGGDGDDFVFGTEGSLDQYFGEAGNDTVSFEKFSDNISASLDNEFASFFNGSFRSEIDMFGFENLMTGSGNDTVTGNNGANTLDGGAGDDLITGLDGNDVIFGGAGTDYAIYSGVSRDYSITDNGNGTFTITDLDGNGDGSDTLTDVEFARFADIDVALVSSGINLTPNNDVYSGTASDEIINALAGNDVVNGLGGDDIINGDDGADRLIGGLGADTLNGGAGFDTADYRGASSGVRFDVVTGGTLGEAAGDSFSSIERYYLSDFNDIVTGSNANEFFYGEDGNDTINAGGGIDRLYGGNGNDVQRGQGGNDQLYGSAGSDQLNGGTGFDIANYRGASTAVIVNFATGGTGGDAAGDTYFGIEALYGSDFNDTIIGNSSTNELRGFDGDDILDGAAGSDRLYGGAGADSLNGGTGTDIAMYLTATSGVTLDLVTGGTTGEAAGDSFTSIEWVYGSNFNDDITGDSGNNRLEGRGGDDILNGAAGNDRLQGGDGNDTINGGDGVDAIFGQNGNDMLFGGAGNDFFFGGAGADSHDGGAGIDSVSYLASSSGVTLNMQSGGTGGDAAGDSYVSIERIFGSGQDDSLTGSNSDDVLNGNGGADVLAGGLGDDSLNGGAGVDSFVYDTTQDESDVIQGFTTNETIFILGGDPAFDSFAEIMAAGSNAAANTIFDFGGGNILTIVGKNLADFSASNFDFSGVSPAAPPLSDPDAFDSPVFESFDANLLDMDALF